TSQALNQTGESAEKVNIKSRDMHKIMHELNHIAPGLGSAFRAAFNPASLGILAFIFVLQQVKKVLDESKQAAEEHARASVAQWEAQRQAVMDAKTAADEYAEAISKIGTNVDTLKQKEDNELATLNAILEARKKILDAQEAAELAAAKNNPIAQAEI